MFKLFHLVFISLKYFVYQIAGFAQVQQVHDYAYGSMYQEEGLIGPNAQNPYEIDDPLVDWNSVNC